MTKLIKNNGLMCTFDSKAFSVLMQLKSCVWPGDEVLCRCHVYMYSIIMSCHLLAVIPYSQNFSRDPIFAERLYAKISRSNFRGWAIRVARMCV